MRFSLAILAFSSSFLLSDLAAARIAVPEHGRERAAAFDGVRVAQTVKYKKRKVHRPSWGSLENAQRKMKQGSKGTGFKPKSQPVLHRNPVLSKKAKFVSVPASTQSTVVPSSQARPANTASSGAGWWSLLLQMKWVLLGVFGIGAVGLVLLRNRPS